MSYSERINTVKGDIDALVTYANETTGESDKTISEAVGHLVDGFGGGSGDLTDYVDVTVTQGTFKYNGFVVLAKLISSGNMNITPKTGYKVSSIQTVSIARLRVSLNGTSLKEYNNYTSTELIESEVTSNDVLNIYCGAAEGCVVLNIEKE